MYQPREEFPAFCSQGLVFPYLPCPSLWHGCAEGLCSLCCSQHPTRALGSIPALQLGPFLEACRVKLSNRVLGQQVQGSFLMADSEPEQQYQVQSS